MNRVLRGLGFVLMMAIFVFFTGFGVVLLIAGDGAARMLGLICVLMFGFGGATYFMSRRRRSDVALRVETVTFQGAPIRALVVPIRKAKWLTTLLGVLGMGAAMVLMALNAAAFKDPGESALFIQIVGYAGGAFFLLLGLRHLIAARQGPPRLALLEAGIDLTGAAAAFVPWEIVAAVGRYDMTVRGSTQRFAGVRVTDRNAIRRPRFSRFLMTGTRAMSGWDVTYAEATFDVTADQLMDLIAAFHERPDLRRVAASLPEGDLSFDEFVAAAHLGGSGFPGASVQA